MTETTLFECPECGRTVRMAVNSARHSVRCPDCAKAAKLRATREWLRRNKSQKEARQPKPKKSIAQIVKEASAAGMTYGKYVASKMPPP